MHIYLNIFFDYHFKDGVNKTIVTLAARAQPCVVIRASSSAIAHGQSPSEELNSPGAESHPAVLS